MVVEGYRLSRAIYIWVLLLALVAQAQDAATDAPTAQAEGKPLAPSAAVASAPATPAAPAEARPAQVERVHFAGFDLGVSLSDASGLYFSRESYYNVLNLTLEPSFALGARLAGPKSYWGPLSLSGQLPIDFGLSATSGDFSGSTFSSTTLFSAPETVPISQAQSPEAGQVDGPTRRPVQVRDSWLSLSHPRLVRVPGVGLELGLGLRVVLPTSTASRNQGLITAPSLGLSLGGAYGPLELGYGLRFAKYFFTRSSPAIVGARDTFTLNGKVETAWRPDSTGVTNPDYALVQGLTAAVHLPAGFAISASYLLFHARPLPLSGCAVPGVPTADLCTDGALVGPVVPDAWRHEQGFTASVDYDAGVVLVGLGLATYRGLWTPDGKAAQPFVHVTRDNATTLSLSVSTSPELIARALDKESP